MQRQSKNRLNRIAAALGNAFPGTYMSGASFPVANLGNISST
jgi:hypothetical protein